MIRKIKIFLNKVLTSKATTSIFAFLFIFYTGWASAETAMQLRQSGQLYDHFILGLFSLIFGILELYKLCK